MVKNADVSRRKRLPTLFARLIGLPPLAGLSGRNARFEISDAIINTTAPLPSLPGRKPSFAALLMFHRAKLSVPVGQANRGGLVFVYAG